MTLNNIPNGTFIGDLVGTFLMEGDLEGEVTLDLVFDGELQADGNDGTERAPGTTTVTGTAVSGNGTYEVDLTL